MLTLIGGAAIHVGLNVANDVFDAMSGADDANVNPTQYSGGSRVIQRGLVSLRSMSLVSLGAYVVGIGIGVFLAIDRASVELFVIGAIGVFLSLAYTAPPFRLVHHGLGEITTALGFGPLMVLGAYVVQAKSLSFEAFLVSVPVAILVALILYVNEIPDRRSDASVGKRTLPARLSQEAVINLFLASGLAAFGAIVAGVAFGVLPVWSLLALLALPTVFAVWHGLRAWYGDPYALMATMGKNVQLHMVTGLLLFVGYVIAIVIGHAGGPGPAELTLARRSQLKRRHRETGGPGRGVRVTVGVGECVGVAVAAGVALAAGVGVAVGVGGGYSSAIVTKR